MNDEARIHCSFACNFRAAGAESPTASRGLICKVPKFGKKRSFRNSPRAVRGAEMKRIFVSTLLTLTVLAPLALSAQTTVFKFHQDGEFASLSQSSDPNNSFSLNVSRNFSTAAGNSASLSYTGFSFAA